MNYIIDPGTLLKHSVLSKNGKMLLKQYIKAYQNGGAAVKLAPHMIDNPPNLGPHSCISNALNILGYGNEEDIKELQKQGLIYTCTQKSTSNIQMSGIIKNMNRIETYIRNHQRDRIIKEDEKISKDVHFEDIKMYEIFLPEAGLNDFKKKSKWMNILKQVYDKIPEGYARAVVLTWNYLQSHIIVAAKENNEMIIIDPQFNPKVFKGEEQVLKYIIKKNEQNFYIYPIQIKIIMSSLHLKSPIANNLRDIYDGESDSDTEMKKLKEQTRTQNPRPNKLGKTASFETEKPKKSTSSLSIADLKAMGPIINAQNPFFIPAKPTEPAVSLPKANPKKSSPKANPKKSSSKANPKKSSSKAKPKKSKAKPKKSSSKSKSKTN